MTRVRRLLFGSWVLALAFQPLALAVPPPCQDPDLVRLEANYIAASQHVRRGDPASGAINNVYGAPTWVVPRENALAMLGLLRGSESLGDRAYLDRAEAAAQYLLRVQDDDGGWFDQYAYDQPALLSKSPTQTAEVMIAINKLGFQRKRYRAMVRAADFLLRLQDPVNKTGQDDGLIAGGLNAQGQHETWRWTSDNAFAYQALRAAARWARILRDRVHQRWYEDAAAQVLHGIDEVLQDPASPVWYVAVDAHGSPTISHHEWISYAPQMLDVPAQGVGDPAVGEWIHEVLVHQPEGAARWDDATFGNRLSPGFSFQAVLVWIDLHQFAFTDDAFEWVGASGLHQMTPDANGIVGGWIDWVETTGNQAQFWERFIDTSFYAIVAATDGFDFSPEP